MIRVFALLSLSTALLCANTLSRYELLAKELKYDGDKVVAQGDVIIYSKDGKFRANKAIYYPKTKELELFGDVNLAFKNKDKTVLDYTKIDLKNNNFSSKKFFAYDDDAKIWFQTKNSIKEKDIITLKKSVISSCDRVDPAWKIKFSKGKYNKKKEYISIYNPTFYAGSVPILYLPWFGFPTNKHRKTGFLRPIVGYENRENIFLVTPYYIAPSKEWDLELDPQIRLKRGVGLYSTFRFADTNNSFGSLTTGYFKDNNSYVKRHDLKNKIHKGVILKYQNRRLLSNELSKFSDSKYDDALFIDAIYLNDIDFVNLNHKNGYASTKLATSTINYFMHNSINYFGLYAKYFIDTEKKSNKDTLQTLPSFEYHRYSHSIFLQNLLYSIDYKLTNNYRKEGLNALINEVNIPIAYYFNLFDEYLGFKISENIYYSRIHYSNEKENLKDASYFSNYHKFSLTSDLSKVYKNFIHNIQSQLSFVLPSATKKSGYFAPFIPFNSEIKNISLKINQYFYDKSGFNFLLHRFIQTYYDNDMFYKYGDTQNQIIYYPKKYLKLDNTLFYSHKFHKLRKIQSGLSYNKNGYNINLNHTYEYKEFEKNSDFITSYLEGKVDDRYSLFASYDYDLEDKFTKEWSIGWKYKKRCWDYMFRYKESVTPNLTSQGAKSVTKRGVLFFVRFYPFGGVKYEYNKESDLENDFDKKVSKTDKETR